MTSGGGWKAITYTLRTAQQVGWLQVVARHAQQERVQDVCAWHGRSDAAGWSTRPATSPKSARSRCRRWRRTCRTGSPRSSLLATRSRNCERFRRASSKRAAGSSIRSTPARATRHYRVIAWDEALDRLSSKPDGERTESQFLLRQRPVVERGGIPAAVVGAGVRNELRQQLFVLLPSGERRRTDGQPRHGHCAPCNSKTSSAAISTS